MSGYSLYEFLAIDHPLSQTNQESLRKAFSSEARSTATSFIYLHDNFTDFRRSVQLMERWFDLQLRHTSMGTRCLTIRVPKSSVRRADLEPFTRHVDWVEVGIRGGNAIIDVYIGELAGYDGAPELWDDDGRRLASIAPLRAAVLSGDLRLFYLLWLLAVVLDLVPDDEVEPLPGIGPLTAALEAAATFFCIDADFLAAAAERGADEPAASRIDPGDSPAVVPDRTALALRNRARELWEARRDAERRRLAEKEENERRIRIDVLRTRGDEVWQEIEVEIERRIAQGYDRAMVMLSDLKVLAGERGRRDDFDRRLASIRRRHEKKTKFIERLNRLG